MEQKLLCPPAALPFAAPAKAHVELAQVDLIFTQDLGMVPKRLVRARRPLMPPTERKWLGADFSHVIVSQ